MEAAGPPPPTALDLAAVAAAAAAALLGLPLLLFAEEADELLALFPMATTVGAWSPRDSRAVNYGGSLLPRGWYLSPRQPRRGRGRVTLEGPFPRKREGASFRP